MCVGSGVGVYVCVESQSFVCMCVYVCVGSQFLSASVGLRVGACM